jgi:hypothetical protein
MCCLPIETEGKLHGEAVIVALQVRQKWPPACVQKHLSALCKFGNGKKICIGRGFIPPRHCGRGEIHQERARMGQEMARIGHGLSVIQTGEEMAEVGHDFSMQGRENGKGELR